MNGKADQLRSQSFLLGEAFGGDRGMGAAPRTQGLETVLKQMAAQGARDIAQDRKDERRRARGESPANRLRAITVQDRGQLGIVAASQLTHLPPHRSMLPPAAKGGTPPLAEGVSSRRQPQLELGGEGVCQRLRPAVQGRPAKRRRGCEMPGPRQHGYAPVGAGRCLDRLNTARSLPLPDAVPKGGAGTVGEQRCAAERQRPTRASRHWCLRQ